MLFYVNDANCEKEDCKHEQEFPQLGELLKVSERIDKRSYG
jgi:hypothetical protein